MTAIAQRQLSYHIEHYDLTHGLPQRTVMDIIQDSKGFMWFGTWDGLCKFDGYGFTSHKAATSDTIIMKNNRIDKIFEDSNGYLWVHTYNKETLCFDPGIGKYVGSFHYGGVPFYTNNLFIQPSGSVWLTSETMGVTWVYDAPSQYRIFNINNGFLESNTVRGVHEDTSGNVWLLTGRGLVSFPLSDPSDRKVWFTGSAGLNDTEVSFHSVHETDQEIWFGGDKGRIFCYNKKEERFRPFRTGYGSDIVSIRQIIDNRILVLTNGDGYFVTNNDKIVLSAYHTGNTPALPSDRFLSAFIDSEMNIWLETDSYEVVRFDFLNNKVGVYTTGIPDENAMISPAGYSIMEDNSGRVWVYPRGGRFSWYDRAADCLRPFHNRDEDSGKGFTERVNSCYFDRQGNLWLSTRSEVLEKIVFEEEVFRLTPVASLSDADSEIRAIFEDRYQRLWVGCKDNRIRVYGRDKKLLGYLCRDGSISMHGHPVKGMAYCIFEDSRGDIFIGTKGSGLYYLEQTGNDRKYNIENYTHDAGRAYSLSDDNVYTVHEDGRGRIWIGSYGGGLNLWDPGRRRFINCNNELAGYPFSTAFQVRHINSDAYGNIYVATTYGLLVFKEDFSSPLDIHYHIYTGLHQSDKTFQGNDILYIYKTSSGDIYLSTYGGGLNKLSTRNEEGYPETFIHYDTSNGLPSDVVLSLIEDTECRIWVATEGYLSKYDPDTGTFEVFSNVRRLLHKNYISEAGPVRLHTGEICFGCLEGILTFYPPEVTVNNYVPYLAFTRLTASGKEVTTGSRGLEAGKMELSHKDNTFTIEYAALDFIAPYNIQYAYLMEGVDKQWVYNGKQRTVNYSNLPPGEYLFKVRSTNSNGNWVENEQSLLVTIRPSFWQTGYALFLYVVFSLVALFGILYSIILFYRMKDKVKLEKEQTELKTRFFTDISHEIRTPLTMIVSPVENILYQEELPDTVEPQLKLVLKNANRMLKMVNQILDFRKIQKQKLKVQEVAIGLYVAGICDNFFKAAGQKGINLSVNNEVKADTVWVDCHSLEQLIFNLVSNAIKYTLPGKPVEVNIFRCDKTIALRVKDEGKGMSQEISSKLFTRFASFNTDKSKPSTGIGLSIVKEVADRHHARIVVESEPGKGSVFTVFFPVGKEHFSNDPYVELVVDGEKVTEAPEEPNLLSLPEELVVTEENENRVPAILVVEDDPDLRGFIRTVLENDYQVFEAADGEEGYRLALDKLPDFILSDIMMPGIDGHTFLRKIRENSDTSHIPFILLTAKANIDDRLEGAESGADDYITKPFNVKLLKARINSIISRRQRYYDYVVNNRSHPVSNEEKEVVTEEVKIHPRDEKFLEQIRKEVERNMDNNEYLVDDLVATTPFSRKVFFRKLKSLTGLAPVEFIREVRLKHAAGLLTSGYYVKEVAYMVGFADLKYFSKCFKKAYGVTPTQFKERSLKS